MCPKWVGATQYNIDWLWAGRSKVRFPERLRRFLFVIKSTLISALSSQYHVQQGALCLGGNRLQPEGNKFPQSSAELIMCLTIPPRSNTFHGMLLNYYMALMQIEADVITVSKGISNTFTVDSRLFGSGLTGVYLV